MRRSHRAGALRGRGARRPRRGMYLLPSLFTVGNIFCGYVSMVRATTGDYEAAALFVLVAALLDALDGRVARLTGTSSAFGLQFDSIADVVSFGVAPALLAWTWCLSSLGRAGWAVSFLFVISGAMRLARFNLNASSYDRRYFVGLPIPAAACVVATTVFAHPRSPNRAEDPFIGALVLALVLLISLLMVSRVRYRSFKDLDLRSRRSYLYLLVPAAALALVALHPQIMLLLGSFAYLLSGILPRWPPGREPAGDPAGEVRATGRPAGGDDGV